ncbi:hypothetical protein BDW72DRAFT_186342 [Aspergillus terricola var. indicus]
MPLPSSTWHSCSGSDLYPSLLAEPRPKKFCCCKHLWSLHLKPAARAIVLWAIPRQDVPGDLSTSQA